MPLYSSMRTVLCHQAGPATGTGTPYLTCLSSSATAAVAVAAADIIAVISSATTTPLPDLELICMDQTHLDLVTVLVLLTYLFA